MLIKKAKGTKKCVIKKEIMFNNYIECLKNRKNILKNNKDLRMMYIIFIQKKLIKQHYHLKMIKD